MSEGDCLVPPLSQLEQTCERIRQKLARGELSPGQRLSRRALAREVGASAGLVQQALLRLKDEGVVVCEPQRGTYPRQVLLEEYSDLCDVRELVEPYAAARACEQMTAEILQELNTGCDRFEHLLKQLRRSEISVAERQTIVGSMHVEEEVFHLTIIRTSGSKLLEEFMKRLRLLETLAVLCARWTLTAMRRRARIAVGEHRDIVKALEARDADLARARMLAHVQGGRVSVSNLEIFESADPGH